MPLRNVTFANWLRSHGQKDPEERWLRELYPWPVLAQVECAATHVGRAQRIVYDGVEYEVTLKSVRFQPKHDTWKYRLLVESDGLGWHSRSFSDEFDMCGAPDGSFVTLFHAKTEEPLEKIARAFFGRRWGDLSTDSFKTLAVSRFLAASIVGQVAEKAFQAVPLTHYPEARLIGGGTAPMLASGRDLWLGYRFFSENAYHWARRSAGNASRVVALYFADTKYQFNTDLPAGTQVQSIAELDSTELGGRHEDLIRTLLRGLEVPTEAPDPEQLATIVLGHTPAPVAPVNEADVHEALAALKRPCGSKSELRYQLAAAVVLNAWIESERRLGFSQRKKFYAFKQKVDSLAKWATEATLPGVRLWAEALPGSAMPLLFVRVDEVDFSFHAIPIARRLLDSGHAQLMWSGVRLKPIAPLVLAWARALRRPEDCAAVSSGK
ncbi:MAG: hypothetical protein O3C40_32725 [Planctomycetota bacterium]|nr:hypothetical protein [Planctomycetota bacterium]